MIWYNLIWNIDLVFCKDKIQMNLVFCKDKIHLKMNLVFTKHKISEYIYSILFVRKQDLILNLVRLKLF